MTAVDANVSPDGATRREDAIHRYGVTYLHGGPWRSPIVETLGRHAHDPDPALGRRCFPTEADAVAHVRSLAEGQALRDMARLEGTVPSPWERRRLWLARNWTFWRSREVGILTTDDIVTVETRRLRAEASSDAEPTVERLPDVVRLPIPLSLDATVYVVDIGGFPYERMEVTSDAVARRTVVTTPDHPLFDFVLRYGLANTPGSFAYDTTDPDTARLSSTDENVRVFLDENGATKETLRLAANLRDAMSRAEPEKPAEPPPPEPDWSPCEHVGGFLDQGTRVVRPSGISDEDSLSRRFMAWAEVRSRPDRASTLLLAPPARDDGPGR